MLHSSTWKLPGWPTTAPGEHAKRRSKNKLGIVFCLAGFFKTLWSPPLQPTGTLLDSSSSQLSVARGSIFKGFTPLIVRAISCAG